MTPPTTFTVLSPLTVVVLMPEPPGLLVIAPPCGQIDCTRPSCGQNKRVVAGNRSGTGIRIDATAAVGGVGDCETGTRRGGDQIVADVAAAGIGDQATVPRQS